METIKEFFGYFMHSVWLFFSLIVALLLLLKRLSDLSRLKQEERVEAERAICLVNAQIEAAEMKERERLRMGAGEGEPPGGDLNFSH
ncbi:MAG: hypothetical protein ABIZ49_11700 [Opitutaceae bacterium]